MPTSAQAVHPVASRRVLRLALGSGLSLLCSQAVAWPLAFIAPIITFMFLALPVPAPNVKKTIVFVFALIAPMVAGMAMLPFLEAARWAGVLLVALAMFYTFYLTARGGPPVVGTLLTIGLTLVVTIGSVNPDVMITVVQYLAIGAAAGMFFVLLAHAFIPDVHDPGHASMPAAPKGQPVDPRESRRTAIRSMFVVFPLALAFMFMSGSMAYTVVMIKVAAIGQQANLDSSQNMGKSLIASTLWGGLGAIAIWNVLSIWPSLLIYTLLVSLAALLVGRRIFTGRGMTAKASMWSYAFVTMLILIAPAVTDSPLSSDAGSAFWSRMSLILFTSLYGSLTVAVFDAFWPKADSAPAKPVSAAL